MGEIGDEFKIVVVTAIRQLDAKRQAKALARKAGLDVAEIESSLRDEAAHATKMLEKQQEKEQLRLEMEQQRQEEIQKKHLEIEAMLRQAELDAQQVAACV